MKPPEFRVYKDGPAIVTASRAKNGLSGEVFLVIVEFSQMDKVVRMTS